MTCNNYRNYANYLSQLMACARDSQIEAMGICVNAMLPVNSNGENVTEFDFYGDMNAINRQDKVMWLIPQYDNYYQLLDVLGHDPEDPLPLECIVKSTDIWPKDTIFRLPVLNTATNEMEDIYWRVISEFQKHLDVPYERKIKAVPARKHEIEGIN